MNNIDEKNETNQNININQDNLDLKITNGVPEETSFVIEKIEKISLLNLNIERFKLLLKNKWLYVTILGIFAISFFIIGLFQIFSDENLENKNNTPFAPKNDNKNTDDTKKPVVEKKEFKSLTTGKVVNEKDFNPWPTVIVIENSKDARPITSISKADIVYEILAEGSITRFLGIYTDKNINKVGPVRSARPYLLQIAEEYKSLFVHFGGSSEALDNIDSGKYKITSMNGIIYDGIYLYRDKSRLAPHNAYTNSDLINKYKEKTDKKEIKGDFTPFTFTDKSIQELCGYTTGKTTSITLMYSSESNDYNVVWKYDAKNNIYTRYYLNGKMDVESDGKPIITDNIIIQSTTTSVIDEKARKKIDLTEGGNAIMIRDGLFVKGYWRRDASLKKTKFYITVDGKEKEYQLKPGKTWINIIPKENIIKID